jgi:hypothetical protein
VSAAISLTEYYADPHVRARIREYLGASPAAASGSAAYVASLNRQSRQPIMWENAIRRPLSQLDEVWADGSDVARSLLDTGSLIFLFELDYLNPEIPAEPFIHPSEVLRRLEPAYEAVRSVAESFGVWPYTLVTGRGYHFTGRIPLTAGVVGRLADVVPATPAWLETVATRSLGGPPCSVSVQVARAWTGLGCLVEHLAHLVLETETTGAMPVVFNGTPVGAGRTGRECVSVDFSYVGDPLDTRFVRCAFSAYQTHAFRPDIFGDDVALGVPSLAAVPRASHSLSAFLRLGRSLDAGRRAARRGPAILPDVTVGIERLLEHYLASPLAAFHRGFYEERRRGPSARRRTLSGLPPCVAASLQQPNDLLLRPEHIQHLVRTLLARGWSAAEVAGLVQSAYEADHGWGDRWRARMDAATRAEFDVRVFAGMVITGADRLIDFNCVSAQEKDLCPQSDCRYDLRIDRDRLRRQTR